MPERVAVFSGGGTGGHLYPALAIADALRAARADVRVVFVGARRGLEARVLPERGEEHLLLPVRGIDRSRPLSIGGALMGLTVGLARVTGLFRELRPGVVVVTGGYAGAAAGIAAVLLRIPLVLQEQNSFPGLVTRFLARFAIRVHVAFPEAVDRLPGAAGRCVVTGNPVRAASVLTRDEARGQFGISTDALLALVTGGSQGALGLNRGLVAYVSGVTGGALSRPDNLHLLWATGPKHFENVDAAVAGAGAPSWVHTLPYIEDMPAALAAADFAVGRAGAMTIAEFLNQGLPALLIPLPSAAEDHQLLNARALEAAGAARVLPEAELDASTLERELTVLADRSTRHSMAEQAARRALPDATERVAGDIASFLVSDRRAA